MKSAPAAAEPHPKIAPTVTAITAIAPTVGLTKRKSSHTVALQIMNIIEVIQRLFKPKGKKKMAPTLPVEDTVEADAPVADAPMEDAPMDDAPVDDAPMDDAASEDAVELELTVGQKLVQGSQNVQSALSNLRGAQDQMNSAETGIESAKQQLSDAEAVAAETRESTDTVRQEARDSINAQISLLQELVATL